MKFEGASLMLAIGGVLLAVLGVIVAASQPSDPFGAMSEMMNGNPKANFASFALPIGGIMAIVGVIMAVANNNKQG